jgi:cell division septation protein DedD
MNTNKYEYLVDIKVKINETGYDIFLEKVFNSLNTKLNNKVSVDDEVDDSVDYKVDYSVDVKVYYKSENLDKEIVFKIEYTTSSIATVEYIYANKNTTDGNIDGHDYNNYTYEFYEIDIVNNNNIKEKEKTDYVIELPINLLYVYLIDVLKKNIGNRKFNIKDIEDIEEITTKSDEYNPPKEPEMPVEVAGEKYLHNIKNYDETVKDAVIEKYKDDIKVWSEKLNEYEENYIRKYGIHKFAIMRNKYESENKMSWLPSLTEVAKAAKAAEAAKAAKAAQAAQAVEEAKAEKVEPRSLKDLYGKTGGIGGKNIKVKNNEPKYKDILGKRMKIYKKPDSRKEYVKYKKELISILDYKKLAKLKAKSLAKTKITSKPKAKPAPKPKAKPATKPKAKPSAKSATKPKAKPASKSTTKTTIKSATKAK